MNDTVKGTFLTPVKAIRAKCLDCCCGQSREVSKCPLEKCPLHPYRLGHRPKSILCEKTPGKVGGFEGSQPSPEDFPVQTETR